MLRQNEGILGQDRIHGRQPGKKLQFRPTLARPIMVLWPALLRIKQGKTGKREVASRLLFILASRRHSVVTEFIGERNLFCFRKIICKYFQWVILFQEWALMGYA